MLTPVKRLGAQRLLPSGAVSAFKQEKLQSGGDGTNELPVTTATDVRGPFLSQNNLWRTDAYLPVGSNSGHVASLCTPNNATTSNVTTYHATQPGTHSYHQLLNAATLQQQPQNPVHSSYRRSHSHSSSQETLSLSYELLQPFSPLSSVAAVAPLMTSNVVFPELCDEQPVLDMEAFLQELPLGEVPSPQTDLSYFDTSEIGLIPELPISAPLTSGFDMATLNTTTTYDSLLMLAIAEPAKAAHALNALSFEALSATIGHHIWNVGPVPDIALFYLFRKVHSEEQADQAIKTLVTDREVRTSQGMTTPYSEVTSAAVFNALNRTVGETYVVAAAEKSIELGLTLSRSNMYHLMKQYSVQGKVDHVEKLFRALESSGKSWNSNCIVIMMLAYFNQGRFEDADQLRRELTSRGIKISERIETRLDKLLSGEEKWRWEDKVFYRPKRAQPPLAPPPGFRPLYLPMMAQSLVRNASINRSTSTGQTPRRSIHSLASTNVPAHHEPELDFFQTDMAPVTLIDAVKEPRIHLNILRSAGFEDLLNVLVDFVRKEGPVENVCISFLFRKVESKRDVEKGMEFLRLERAARGAAGISEEYNETTCSRIFTALFRTGASELAFQCAENAHESGLVLSGKALHELLKSFATKNDVDKVEEIWRLVKLNGKPSSRIVYSIFRTYFDNGMMDRAKAFHNEIQSIGINLSASATRNIEDVLSGQKNWVRDPHSTEF